MKSPLRRLRGFALHKHDAIERREFLPYAQLDELARASQDMEDMKTCYDSLLSAAAATANSAYEFSESLRDMGACLLERNALNDDEDSGKILLMLGKLQFELHKLADNYRSHITKTIINPSESLLNELRTVEEMKHQCDEKRNIYEDMVAAQKVKGKHKPTREQISFQRIQMAHEEFDEEATLFVFRMKSLKQGQSRSLLTQAARHHAAQLNFFKKGLKSLEVVEPQLKVVTEKQHIDYHFSGLEEDVDDADDEGYDANYDGDLSFDYGVDDRDQPVLSSSAASMELDQMEITRASSVETTRGLFDEDDGDPSGFSRRSGVSSQSAPIFSNKKFVQVQQDLLSSSTRKLHTYTLPTPVDAKILSTAGGSTNVIPGSRQENFSNAAHHLRHSPPVEPLSTESNAEYDQSEGPDLLKERESHSASLKVPPPLFEGLRQSELQFASDPKKIKRNAFSGPLAGKAWSNTATWKSGRPTEQFSYPQASVSLKRPTSPPRMSPPKIIEVHELPRPPVALRRPTNTNMVTHSAPLASRSREFADKAPSISSHSPSPLPMPPGTISRSLSIPSSSGREMRLTVDEADSPQLVSFSSTQGSQAFAILESPYSSVKQEVQKNNRV